MLLTTFRDDTLLGRTTNQIQLKFKKDYSQTITDIKGYFSNINKPICFNNIDDLKKLLVNVHDHFSVSEDQRSYQYDLNVVSKNNQTDCIHLTCYGSRVMLDVKIGDFEFTQLQVMNNVYQKYTLKLVSDCSTLGNTLGSTLGSTSGSKRSQNVKHSTFNLEVQKEFDSQNNLISCNLHFTKPFIFHKIFLYEDCEKNSENLLSPSDVALCIATFVGKVNYKSKKTFTTPLSFIYKKDELGYFDVQTQTCNLTTSDGLNHLLHIGSLADIVITEVDELNSNFSLWMKNKFGQVIDIDFICNKDSELYKSIYEVAWNLSESDMTKLINDNDIRLDAFFKLTFDCNQNNNQNVYLIQIRHTCSSIDMKYSRKQMYHHGELVFDANVIEKTGEVESIFSQIDNINYCSKDIHGNVFVNHLDSRNDNLIYKLPSFVISDRSFLIQFAQSHFPISSNNNNYHVFSKATHIVDQNVLVVEHYKTYNPFFGNEGEYIKSVYVFDPEKKNVYDLELIVEDQKLQTHGTSLYVGKESFNYNGYTFNVEYNPPISTYGGGCGCFGKRKIKTKVKNEKDVVQSISKIEHNENGHLAEKMEMDENNALNVITLSEKDKRKRLKFAYKAAITKDGIKCIVKLIIPDDAQVVWNDLYDKVRVNKVRVYSIKPVIKGNYAEDIRVEQCVICSDKIGNVMALPCRHKMCDNCWEKVNKCPFCRGPVTHFKVLKATSDNAEMSFSDALSFVHTFNFSYVVGEIIEVPDFDGDKSKGCSNGIHCHFKESDVFKWFEFLDIPEHTKQIIDSRKTNNKEHTNVTETNDTHQPNLQPKKLFLGDSNNEPGDVLPIKII